MTILSRGEQYQAVQPSPSVCHYFGPDGRAVKDTYVPFLEYLSQLDSFLNDQLNVPPSNLLSWDHVLLNLV